MSDSSTNAKDRLVAGTADLIGRRGLRGSSVRDLAQHSGTPEGSTYHYFPGGKQQLAAAAVRFMGEQVAQVVGAGLQAGPEAGLRTFIEVARGLMVSTEFLGGCTVLAIAVEGPDGAGAPRALDAAAEVFARWQDLLAESLERHGVASDQARQVGTLVVAAIEGAVALCRARQSIGPLDDVAASLESLVAKVLADTR